MSLFGKRHPQWAQPPAMQIDPSKTYHALLQTNKGEVEVELLTGEAPTTVNNFVFLAREGFYDGVPFHRVISGFMVQSGDPTGTGTGGPGYRFADEPVRRPYSRGTVAMANAGPNTNGSQFFIMHQTKGLPPNYTIFGQVTRGLEVVDAIAGAPVSRSRSGEASVPQEELKIERVTINEV
jgi:cyclophilin family peptidyl-prolyl cis-trans isomerase